VAEGGLRQDFWQEEKMFSDLLGLELDPAYPRPPVIFRLQKFPQGRGSDGQGTPLF